MSLRSLLLAMSLCGGLAGCSQINTAKNANGKVSTTDERIAKCRAELPPAFVEFRPTERGISVEYWIQSYSFDDGLVGILLKIDDQSWRAVVVNDLPGKSTKVFRTQLKASVPVVFKLISEDVQRIKLSPKTGAQIPVPEGSLTVLHIVQQNRTPQFRAADVLTRSDANSRAIKQLLKDLMVNVSPTKSY